MTKAPDAAGGLHGLLLIDKQPGWTSHDVVAKARGITRQRKIGHTGTLDPMATGLLVLCLGDATRLVEYMMKHDKRYEGEITLGSATDTDDAEGRAISSGPIPAITTAALEQIASTFTGAISQRPPAYSAISVGGQRAYAAARAGASVALPERAVLVHSLVLAQLAGDRLQILLHCGPGTYVRSIARDIGAVLGCGAHLSRLRRTQVGNLDVASAITLDGLSAARDRPDGIADVLLPVDEGVSAMQAAILGPDSAANFSHGNSLALEVNRPAAGILRIYDSAGSFFGMGEISDSGRLKATKVLANSR